MCGSRKSGGFWGGCVPNMCVQVVACVLCVHQKQKNLPPMVNERVADQLCVFLFDIGGRQKITYVVGIEGIKHLIRIVPV